jgi:hypothetical protein
LLCAHEGGAEHYLAGRELPLLSVLVSENEEHSVFRRVVQTSDVLRLGVHFGPILARGAVGLVPELVRREVVQIHVAAVGVVCQQVLVKFCDLFELSDVALEVQVVLVHNVAAHLHLLHVPRGGFHKDGRPLDNEADVDAHHVAREDLKLGGVHVVQLFEALDDIVLLGNSLVLGEVLSVVYLLHELLALLLKVVKVVDDLLLGLVGVLVDDNDVAGLFVVDHLRLFIVEDFLLRAQAEHIDFAVKFQLEGLNLPSAVAERAAINFDQTLGQHINY